MSIKKGPVFARPEFTKKFINYKLVKVDETVILKASFIGTPVPTVEWLKNGEPVNPQSAVVKIIGDETILTIAKIQLSDEGEYICKLRNSAGHESAKCQIDLEKKFVPKADEPVASAVKDKKKSSDAPRKPREPREPR
jgi:neogenin